MNHITGNTEELIACVYQKYLNMVYRISVLMLGNAADAEDATQTVFMKYMMSNTLFEQEEHVKAWLITTTRNICRDALRGRRRKNSRLGSLEEATEQGYVHEYHEQEIWGKVSRLKDTEKLPIYLYYYEGYKTEEIANMLKVNHGTVRTRLKAARRKLKLMMEEGEELA